MKLQVKVGLQEEDMLIIEFNHQKKKLTSEESTVEFEFENKGEYSLKIYQEKENTIRGKFDLWFNVFTWLFRGLFNAIFLNTEDRKWMNNCNPICINTVIKVKLDSSDTIVIDYKRPIYNRNTRVLELPSLIVSKFSIERIQYTANPKNVKKYHRNFMINFLSMGTIVVLLFLFLVYAFIRGGNLELAIFSAVLLGIFIVIIVVTVYVEYVKLNELRKKLRDFDKE